jgi:acyl-CoA reductase-like NAD-dependent aldehyde dehydrogenase
VLRSRVLNEMAERFEARAADLIQLMRIEVGKIVPDATFDVDTVGRASAVTAPRSCAQSMAGLPSGSLDTSRSSFATQ